MIEEYVLSDSQHPGTLRCHLRPGFGDWPGGIALWCSGNLWPHVQSAVRSTWRVWRCRSPRKIWP